MAKLDWSAIFSIAILLGLFLTISYVTGLVSFYSELYSFYTSEFTKYQGAANLSSAFVVPQFKSDSIFNGVVIATMVLSFAALFKRLTPVPLFIVWIIYLISAFSGISFIYPLRTLALIFAISWPIMAFAIKQLVPRKRLIRSVIVSLFILVGLAIQYPHIVAQATTEPGWFLVRSENFQNSYDAAIWLVRNVNQSERILNDRTYSSLYIDGFAIKNLTYDYWNGMLKPEAEESTQKELSGVWMNPYDQEQVRTLLSKNDVRYIILMAEGGYVNYQNWGGDGQYLAKPLSNDQYEEVFNGYPFLELVYRSGNFPQSLIYKVKQQFLE